ncbi:recombinase family protein [Halomonas sp. MM17-34]|uniref:recombinase family protein n=1 Tax=Halomonas sp. MM17-34 TaxID=2917742 RepID=UPI001EF557BD|nr:recombinase family protein [Halomonas sp. MM17-34]MCG7605687.1 recombinase family protein [Halomonas sp. MM17-34]
MFIRGYLRASTDDQDASRARDQIADFASEQGQAVASWYTENASGASAERGELRRLLADAQQGDVLLVESIDRLSRLPADDWRALRAEIEAKGLRIVALDLPTSHTAMKQTNGDDFTARMLDAINSMMLDMMAAIARKDYEQRRQRQAQGIAKAKQEGKYTGRPKDTAKRKRVAELLAAGFSVRKTADHAGVSTYTVQDVKKHGV